MTILVTGANRGLGYATARVLAADRSRTIVLAGHDRDSLGRAARRIEAETGNPQLVPMWLDLAALAAVRAFVTALRSRELPPLQTIICNAGITLSTIRERSADGYELTFAVNHLGHFLLINLLVEQLQAPARIVLVSSGAHNPAEVGGPMKPPRFRQAAWLAFPERDPEQLPDDAAGGQAYATSKLCNVLCTYELARRLEARAVSTATHPITVHAFDPGLMAGTGLGRHGRGLTRFAWYYLLPIASRLFGFGRTTTTSGADLAFIATDRALDRVTGRYWRGRNAVPSSDESYDRAKAADLWHTSVALSELQPDESPVVEPNSRELGA